MRTSWIVGTNCAAFHYLPFQESVDHHHDYQEKDLVPAWKNS